MFKQQCCQKEGIDKEAIYDIIVFMKTIKQLKDYQFNSEERYFLFTDGSLREQHLANPLMGLGATLRNKNGKKVLFYSEEVKVSDLPEFVSKNHYEEYALLNALKICHGRGVKKLVVQNDNSGLISIISRYIENKELGNKKELEKLMSSNKVRQNLFELIDKFEEIFAEHIPRGVNVEADYYSRSTQEAKHTNFLNAHLSIDAQKYASDAAQKIVEQVQKDFLKKSLLTRAKTFYFVPYNAKKDAEITREKGLNTQIIHLFNNSNKNQYEVIFYKRDKNGIVVDNLKKIIAPYITENKQLVLLFLTTNLFTEKSSIPFTHKIIDNSKEIKIQYNHNLWMSFSNMAYRKSNLSRKIFFTLPETLKEIIQMQQFDFSKVISGHNLNLLESVGFCAKGDYLIHTTHNLHEVYRPKLTFSNGLYGNAKS